MPCDAIVQRAARLGQCQSPCRPTATVTATAATNGKQRQSATAQHSRTIRANWGYVRPEKRKVAVQLACN